MSLSDMAAQSELIPADVKKAAECDPDILKSRAVHIPEFASLVKRIRASDQYLSVNRADLSLHHLFEEFFSSQQLCFRWTRCNGTSDAPPYYAIRFDPAPKSYDFPTYPTFLPDGSMRCGSKSLIDWLKGAIHLAIREVAREKGVTTSDMRESEYANVDAAALRLEDKGGCVDISKELSIPRGGSYPEIRFYLGRPKTSSLGNYRITYLDHAHANDVSFFSSKRYFARSIEGALNKFAVEYPYWTVLAAERLPDSKPAEAATTKAPVKAPARSSAKAKAK